MGDFLGSVLESDFGNGNWFMVHLMCILRPFVCLWIVYTSIPRKPACDRLVKDKYATSTASDMPNRTSEKGQCFAAAAVSDYLLCRVASLNRFMPHSNMQL